MAVAALNVDGHNGLMVDVDMDGQMDVLAVDVNDNGLIDPGEAGNIQNWDVSVSDIARASNPDMYLTQDDGIQNGADNTDIGILL
jgi:hypothetical protein